MTTTAKKQSSIIPDMPRDNQIVDSKTGKMTPHWQLYFQQLNLALQSTLQKEGLQAPSQTSTDITNIKNQNNLVGNIIFDSTHSQWKGIIYNDPLIPTTTTVTFTTVP